jgi:hypothetical protein
MTALRKNVGALPTEPTEQNAFWYKLYFCNEWPKLRSPGEREQ